MTADMTLLAVVLYVCGMILMYAFIGVVDTGTGVKTGRGARWIAVVIWPWVVVGGMIVKVCTR